MYVCIGTREWSISHTYYPQYTHGGGGWRGREGGREGRYAMYIRVHPMRDSVYACTGTNEWSIDHIYTTQQSTHGREGEGGRDGQEV